MQTRRQLMQKLGLGVAVVTAGATVSTAARAEHRRQLGAFAEGGSTDAAPWWLVAPLRPGLRLAGGWRVMDLSPVRRGAAVLTLAGSEGVEVGVHICAHGGQAQGLASSRLFDLVLMDGGQGDRPTPVGLAQAMNGLARAISRNEIEAADDLDHLARMLTHAERVELYGPESLT
jgi:hypothetical protein